MTKADREHREQFARFVEESASGPRAEIMRELYRTWRVCNTEYYDGKLVPPYILITQTQSSRAVGDYCSSSCFGGVMQIRIRPDIIDGTHPLLKAGTRNPEGILRYVRGVLLHETIHQYQDEICQDSEDRYKGHGPLFCAECNRIGEKLGLSLVRPARCKDEETKKLPNCAYWPDNVRPNPADYYLGALVVVRTDPVRKVKVPLPEVPTGDPEEASEEAEIISENEAQTVEDEKNNWDILEKEAHKLSPRAQKALRELKETL